MRDSCQRRVSLGRGERSGAADRRPHRFIMLSVVARMGRAQAAAPALGLGVFMDGALADASLLDKH